MTENFLDILTGATVLFGIAFLWVLYRTWRYVSTQITTISGDAIKKPRDGGEPGLLGSFAGELVVREGTSPQPSLL